MKQPRGAHLVGSVPLGSAEEAFRPAAPDPDGRRRDLRADCERCFGLCCVAPAFSASADFAIDKPAGQACPNLQADFRCGIHQRLRQRGFPGCAAYDCFGAGQKVAQVTFGGQDWRRAPHTATRMFEAFAIMRQLHELLWYLTEALRLQPARPLHGELGRALEETERLTELPSDALLELDVAAHRRAVNALLLRASELVRAGLRPQPIDRRGADLIGKDLRGADLRGANLRGAAWRCRPHREPVSDPVPARRGQGQCRHQAATLAGAAGALAGLRSRRGGTVRAGLEAAAVAPLAHAQLVGGRAGARKRQVLAACDGGVARQLSRISRSSWRRRS